MLELRNIGREKGRKERRKKGRKEGRKERKTELWFNKRSVFASLNVGFGYWLSVLALMLARYWHRCCSKFPEYVYIVVDIGVDVSLDILIEVVVNIEVNVGT